MAVPADATNVMRLPTAAASEPPRPRSNSKARRAAIWRGEVIDLQPRIWAHEDRLTPLEPQAPGPPGEKIWVQVDPALWQAILTLGKL